MSTRSVDDLVQAMGLSGIGKSTVSKLCRDIDERVHTFLDRPLTDDWPYLWLDATYLKQREGGRIVSVAAIIAVAVNTDGKREVVGLHIGPSEAETFWSTFLKGLVRRGLHGVKLVVSDAHEGLKSAIRRTFRASWQRCRVHWMQHRTRIHSTNSLERLNKAVKRRADVVGIFPNEGSTIRLIGVVLLETNDEWQTQNQYMQTEPMAELRTSIVDVQPAQITTVAA